MLEQPFMDFAFLYLNESSRAQRKKASIFFFFQRERETKLQGRKFHVAVSMPVVIFIDTQRT